jgi:uncharacterized protein YbaR (Trm112 family)
MQFFAKEQLQLGKTGWILGDLPNLLAGALIVDIYVCPECRKVELYYAANDSEAEESLPKKTCLICGTVHDFDYPKCPKCKHEY